MRGGSGGASVDGGASALKSDLLAAAAHDVDSDVYAPLVLDVAVFPRADVRRWRMPWPRGAPLRRRELYDACASAAGGVGGTFSAAQLAHDVHLVALGQQNALGAPMRSSVSVDVHVLPQCVDARLARWLLWLPDEWPVRVPRTDAVLSQSEARLLEHWEAHCVFQALAAHPTLQFHHDTDAVLLLDAVHSATVQFGGTLQYDSTLLGALPAGAVRRAVRPAQANATVNELCIAPGVWPLPDAATRPQLATAYRRLYTAFRGAVLAERVMASSADAARIVCGAYLPASGSSRSASRLFVLTCLAASAAGVAHLLFFAADGGGAGAPDVRAGVRLVEEAKVVGLSVHDVLERICQPAWADAGNGSGLGDTLPGSSSVRTPRSGMLPALSRASSSRASTQRSRSSGTGSLQAPGASQGAAFPAAEAGGSTARSILSSGSSGSGAVAAAVWAGRRSPRASRGALASTSSTISARLDATVGSDGSGSPRRAIVVSPRLTLLTMRLQLDQEAGAPNALDDAQQPLSVRWKAQLAHYRHIS